MFDSNYIVTDRQPTTQPHPASRGRWGYNRRDNAINYRCGKFRYSVPLTHMHMDAVSWIAHISEKSWATTEVLIGLSEEFQNLGMLS